MLEGCRFVDGEDHCMFCYEPKKIVPYVGKSLIDELSKQDNSKFIPVK